MTYISHYLLRSDFLTIVFRLSLSDFSDRFQRNSRFCKPRIQNLTRKMSTDRKLSKLSKFMTFNSILHNIHLNSVLFMFYKCDLVF